MNLSLIKVMLLSFCLTAACQGQNLDNHAQQSQPDNSAEGSTEPIKNLLTDVAIAIGSPKTNPLEIAHDVTVFFELEPTPQNVGLMLAAMASAASNLPDIKDKKNVKLLLEAAKEQTLISLRFRLCVLATALSIGCLIGCLILYLSRQECSASRKKRKEYLRQLKKQIAERTTEEWGILGEKEAILTRLEGYDRKSEDYARSCRELEIINKQLKIIKKQMELARKAPL